MQHSNLIRTNCINTPRCDTMTGILDGICDDHYTLKVTMCKRSHQPCIGKTQCDRLMMIAHRIEESDNVLADSIHDALADYDRRLYDMAQDIARTGDLTELKELINLDTCVLKTIPQTRSILIDRYRIFVQEYMKDHSLEHERERLMEAIMLMERDMFKRGIPIPMSSKNLMTWWA